jgi:hypothetical protein
MQPLTRLAGMLLLLALTGCSLVSFKSPERPLSDRDMNARILTRELTTHFVEASARSADNIIATEPDATVVDHALRWQLGVIVTAREAELQLAPLMSLLDTWALALQLQAFVAEGGPGAALFGSHQAAVREITDNYADGTRALAHSLLKPQEFADYESFVTGYVRDHPLQDLRFARPSVLTEWSHAKGAESSLLDEVGTIPQALADTGQRLQIYGDTVPTQTVRRTQLLLRESGYGPGEVQASLARLDERLERLTRVAESAPELVHDAEREFRASLREVLQRLDATQASSMAAIHTERVALFADIQEQREAVLAALDVQRKALTADAGRIANQLVRTSGEQVRRLTFEALALLIILAVVVLGLPFGAGYLAGRARAARSRG